MEEECIRFPFMAENILKNLDFMSLVKCKEASRKMKECLDKGRVLWKQMILKNIKGTCVHDIGFGGNISVNYSGV